MGAMHDLAIKRLERFRDLHSTRPNEEHLILGLPADKNADFISGKPGTSMYAEKIVTLLGADHLESTVHALRQLRGEITEAKTESDQKPPARKKPAARRSRNAGDKKHVGDVRWQSIHDRLHAFRKKHADNAGKPMQWGNVAEIMNSCPGLDYVFTKNRISVLMAPSSKVKGISENMAQKFEMALDHIETQDEIGEQPEIPTPAEETASPATKAVMDAYDDIKVKKQAEAYLEDLFGIDISELHELKPAIEHMVVCRRNGTPCHLVVGEVSI